MSHYKSNTPRADELRRASFKPNREQAGIIDNGIAFLNMTAPFWSSILYRELPIVYTAAVPLAATDAHNIFVNPDNMKALGWSVENVAFVEGHEVMHYLLDDLILNEYWQEVGYVTIDNAGNTLPYDHGIMGIAKDYRINAILIDAKLGEMPKEGYYDPAISKIGMESAIEIYAKIYHAEKAKQGPGGFDIHLEPSDEAVTAAKQGMAEPKKALAIAAALQAAEAAGMGTLPAGLRHLIGEILEPKVKWQDQLKASMQRAAGEPKHDWSKVNKRLISRPERIVFARKSNYGCGTIVVGWDTSGSVLSYQDVFFSEMAGIVADLNPAELIVLRCDTKVHNADRLEQPEDLLEFRDAVNDEGIGGGGGTSFVPFFDWIKENNVEPDMLVVLTDTYGSFPHAEPSYPTIWASIVGNPTVPFGKVIEIEME